MTTHPAALEARKRAEERAEHRATCKSVIQSCLEQGVRFIEITPESYNFEGARKKGKHGRMTLAYAPLHEHGRNIFAVSTAICHPNDEFDKVYGRALAGMNMAKGHCVTLRYPTSTPLTIKQWLTHKFTEFSE